MTAKKKAKATTKKDADLAGKSAFVVLYNNGYGKRPNWRLEGNDLHSSLEKAQAYCGGQGDDYAVLEVTLVARYQATCRLEKSDNIGVKFND